MISKTHAGAELSILVHLEGLQLQDAGDLHEFHELATSAGAQIVATNSFKLQKASARSLIGSGQVENLRQLGEQQQAQLVMFNAALTPSQERNLERDLGCRVIDRIGLILDIFAQRAHTHEGKLQVELAQLEHLSTRLVRSRTDLSRQQGGIGLRGPGETQLETDRRLLRIRMRQIRQRLEKVRNQRELARRGRKRAEVPAVSLVGYTNAGKSTLFNALTASGVYAADQLFATLDPTVRRIQLADVGAVTLADTVGFIRHLPHKLVEAFRATLEETANADLLLHVIDAAAVERDEQVHQVEQVLAEIGADQVPVLEVYNKVDLLSQIEPFVQIDAAEQPQRVWLSAANQQGLGLLKDAMAQRLAGELFIAKLCLPHAMGKLRAELYVNNAVQEESFDELGQSCLDLRLPMVQLKRLLSSHALTLAEFRQLCVS